jgi:hypothetical protein
LVGTAGAQLPSHWYVPHELQLCPRFAGVGLLQVPLQSVRPLHFPHGWLYPAAHAVQTPLWQASVLTQSLSTKHVLPVEQGGQLPPPQSTSVSLPSFTPSVHCPTHVCIALQTLLAEQSESCKHATQTPPVQTLPPAFAHGEPSVASLVTH